MVEFAIIQTGGKQYKVQTGELVDVEHLDVQVGGKVELTDVRLVSNEDKVLIGTPTIQGARVLAEVQEQRRGPKIVVFKYKAKTRYRKKTGHRQSYTRLLIQDIVS